MKLEVNMTLSFALIKEGNFVRDFRRHLLLTQQEFSNRYGIPLRTLKRWEASPETCCPNIKRYQHFLFDFFVYQITVQSMAINMVPNP